MTSSNRLEALDALLLSLPDDEGMLLSEFDGFCAGLIVCPEMIRPSEWLPHIWDSAPRGGVRASTFGEVRG